MHTGPTRRSLPALIASFAGVLAWTSAAPGQPSAPTAVAPVAPRTAPPTPITARAEAAPGEVAADSDLVVYQQHVYTLANSFFQGRAPGSSGDVMTTEYFEHHFKKLGLKPAFAEGSYRQEFRFGTKVSATSSTLSCANGGEPIVFAEGGEYTVLGFSPDANVTGELVFAGYSLAKGGPDDAYNTFAESDDLAGKIAIIFRFEPMNEKGKSLWASAASAGGWSSSASLTPKLRLVAAKHPSAIILVNPPGADDPRATKLETTQGTVRWLPAAGESGAKIPGFMLSTEAADKLVRATDAAGRSLMDLRTLADAAGGVIPLSRSPVTLAAKMERTPRVTWNIGAILPGRGALADEYVVIGGHHDHLGFNELGGSRTGENKLHPGADDNASGSAGVLLAATRLGREYAGMPGNTPVRSILFLAFGAEEIGLVGSKAFVDDPPFPTSRITAMLNMDMIGRLRNEEIELTGTGTAVDFDDFLEPMLTASGFEFTKQPGGRGPSDHATFYGANIPVLHFFTGLHDEYHAPADTIDTLNTEGAVRVVDLVTEVASAIATRTEPLVFASTDRARKPGASAVNATTPGDASTPPSPGMGGVRIRFGISPASYSDSKAGVGVGEVFPNTSAAVAGIVAGDRIISWNGTEIADVEDWMTSLAKHKPGDVVDVGIERGGEKLVLKVTLKARESGDR